MQKKIPQSIIALFFDKEYRVIYTCDGLEKLEARQVTFDMLSLKYHFNMGNIEFYGGL